MECKCDFCSGDCLCDNCPNLRNCSERYHCENEHKDLQCDPAAVKAVRYLRKYPPEQVIEYLEKHVYKKSIT